MDGLKQAVLFLLLSFIWGTAFVAISAGLADLPPVLFAGIRYDIAGIIMLVYVITTGSAWWPQTPSDWAIVAIGSVLVIALYNAFLFVGQQEITSGAAAILIAMNPILATVFARAILPSERLSAVGIVGLLLGFGGVALVALPDSANLLASDAIASGFVLLAAVSVAFGSVLMQRIETTISTEATVAWSCVIGAVLLHAVSAGLPSESASQASFTTTAILSIVYLAVFASAIGYFIYFRLLDQVGAIEINLVSYAAPVFATVFGWVLLEETISARTILGFLAIFIGFLLIKRRAIARRHLDAVRTSQP